MDGTLLNELGAVTARTAAALKRADAAGVRVVIATGRPVWWLGPVIDAGFDGIAICMNGAIVYDIAAKEVLSASLLPADLARQFVTDLQVREPRFALAVERAGTQLASCFAEESYDHPWADGIFQRVPRSELLAEPLAKLLVRGTEGSAGLAAHARAAGGDRVTVTYSTDDGLIEVSAPGSTRAPRSTGSPRRGASTRPRSSPSATCPTISRC